MKTGRDEGVVVGEMGAGVFEGGGSLQIHPHPTTNQLPTQPTTTPFVHLFNSIDNTFFNSREYG